MVFCLFKAYLSANFAKIIHKAKKTRGQKIKIIPQAVKKE